ncbi:response regulator transcription factor [Allokutzneria sp. A3M-2-11 16]|uniref:response regulator transcription factor n=1 Tax=Allokutzneria sp. A3M-2-11 16 TaxID=2962043 RepID=UPI0020B639D1|nr:response regulator transcription factor [Allokutzneria sp. A3M-2-11 16]MCP3802951.1 response regulator transcription factor [Allokutzneria sp. A3M-2-11 16]
MSAQEKTRLLVVDDEPTITALLSTSLRFVGFDVRTAASGTEALSVAMDFRPELLVLDVMLPDLDGFEVTRLLRARGVRAPVIFLTARDTTDDKITGLTIGGDDYVTKPFSLEEVVARIRVVLRRLGGHAAEADQPRPVLRFADLELDEETCDVRRAGRFVKLSPTEYKLLHYLLHNAGKVVSKAQILDHVWRYDFTGDARIVESYISLLRRKIDIVEPSLIHTLRGFGYSLRLPQA